jgi:hypothetical protein
MDLHRPVEKDKSSAEARSHPKDGCLLFFSLLSANTHCGFQMTSHPVYKSIPSCRIGVVHEDRAGTVSVKESFQYGYLK